jgi:hypothetical protein
MAHDVSEKKIIGFVCRHTYKLGHFVTIHHHMVLNNHENGQIAICYFSDIAVCCYINSGKQ